MTLCEDICNRGIWAAAPVLSIEFPFSFFVQKQKQILHRSLTKLRFLKAHRHTVSSVAPLEARQKLYTIPLQGIVHYCGSGPNKKSQCCVKGKGINKSSVIREQAVLFDGGFTKRSSLSVLVRGEPQPILPCQLASIMT